jgi:ribosomal protein L18
VLVTALKRNSNLMPKNSNEMARLLSVLSGEEDRLAERMAKAGGKRGNALGPSKDAVQDADTDEDGGRVISLAKAMSDRGIPPTRTNLAMAFLDNQEDDEEEE